MGRWLLAIAVCGCTVEVPYECGSSAACMAEGAAQGRCEATGFCSFPDLTCTSAYRYGAHASEGLAGACVLGPLGFPPATPVVDGQTADWGDIRPVLEDAVGDAPDEYTGADLRFLYVAADDGHLYVRLETADGLPISGPGPAPIEGGRFEVRIDPGRLPGYSVYPAYEQGAWVLYFWDGTTFGVFADGQLGVQAAIELAIPLASIGRPAQVRLMAVSQIPGSGGAPDVLDEMVER